MKNKNNNKKSQAISVDLVIVMALVLFGALFLVFTKINDQEDENFEEVVKKSEVISDAVFVSLQEEGIIEENNAINVERLSQLDEEELRTELGITQDFAIAFEKDGKLIYIDSVQNLSCLGTDKIIINGNNCGFKR